MDYHAPSATKVKVTVSLDKELVNTINNFLKTSKIRSRSQFIENILRKWHHEQKKQDLEKQIEAYYLSQSDKERKEDRRWTEIAAKSAQQLWKD
ncbi:MAG: ribbon-helix-helix domain-containing protein [Candidatus Desulfatibia sp.]|uniref:ribbon-helix-helix domain-containing protein n=1 Tax=Candidatus Desulfatibia sp. TaxID=3101189 RepID=UPI002F31D224